MQYGLRTLLILVAAGPPILAGAWLSKDILLPILLIHVVWLVVASILIASTIGIVSAAIWTIEAVASMAIKLTSRKSRGNEG